MAGGDRPQLVPAPPPVPLGRQAPADEILLVPAPPKQTARALRPLWRDLILRVWGGDPLRCPCCKGTMKVTGTLLRPEEIEFFLRLHGLWEGGGALPARAHSGQSPPFSFSEFQRFRFSFAPPSPHTPSRPILEPPSGGPVAANPKRKFLSISRCRRRG